MKKRQNRKNKKYVPNPKSMSSPGNTEYTKEDTNMAKPVEGTEYVTSETNTSQPQIWAEYQIKETEAMKTEALNTEIRSLESADLINNSEYTTTDENYSFNGINQDNSTEQWFPNAWRYEKTGIENEKTETTLDSSNQFNSDEPNEHDYLANKIENKVDNTIVNNIEEKQTEVKINKEERRDTMRARISRIQRKTNETDIKLELGIDGSGISQIDTGIGFFDHMLNSFARHGLFDLKLAVQGDLIVDSHHTIEDTGIVLGQAIKEAIGDKKGMKRYGSVILPMDEALVLCSLDISGRPYLVYNVEHTTDRVGYMDVEMVKEFFYAISYSAGMNLHIKLLDGSNNHHIIEAVFKAFAKALDEAVQLDHRITDVLSTKGTL